MPVQDEGRVPLGSLPLADLKAWIEDWLQLTGSGIIGGGGSGGSVVNLLQATSDLGWLLEGSLLIPRPPVPVQDAAFILQDTLYLMRFVVPEDITVSHLAFASRSAGNNAGNYMLAGFYNADCSSMLRDVGQATATDAVLTPGGTSAIAAIALTSPLDLSANTEYNFALYYHPPSGQNWSVGVTRYPNVLADNYRAGSNTVDTYASKAVARTITFGSVLTTNLPATVRAAGTPGATGAAQELAPPYVFLR